MGGAMPDKLKQRPLVSVIIPFYSNSDDGSRDIRVAINAVLRQTYQRYEIIVIDDGSPVKAADILRDYGGKVRIIRQPNQGTIAARNTGIANMKGDLIAFLDHDDWWDRNKLELQVRAMQEMPDTGMVFCNLRAVNKQGKNLGFTVISKEWRHDPTWEDLICIYPLYPSSSLIRAELFEKVQYDTKFGLAGSYGDQDFHARLREITRFHFQNRCLGYYYWVNDRKMADYLLANFTHFATKQWDHPNMSGPGGAAIRERFARKVRVEMGVLFRRWLNENGKKANAAMLNRYINYEKDICDKLGGDYLKYTGTKILDAGLFAPDDFTSTILYVFILRMDCQDAFPEVYQGDLSRYMDWIRRVYSGQADMDKPILDQAVDRALAAGAPKIEFNVKRVDSRAIRKPFVQRLLIKSREYIEENGLFEFIKAALKRIITLDFEL